MKATEEIRKEMFPPETKKVVKMFETLDKDSAALVGAYMSALADRQRMEEVRKSTVAV